MNPKELAERFREAGEALLYGCPACDDPEVAGDHHDCVFDRAQRALLEIAAVQHDLCGDGLVCECAAGLLGPSVDPECAALRKTLREAVERKP